MNKAVSSIPPWSLLQFLPRSSCLGFLPKWTVICKWCKSFPPQVAFSQCILTAENQPRRVGHYIFPSGKRIKQFELNSHTRHLWYLLVYFLDNLILGCPWTCYVHILLVMTLGSWPSCFCLTRLVTARSIYMLPGLDPFASCMLGIHYTNWATSPASVCVYVSKTTWLPCWTSGLIQKWELQVAHIQRKAVLSWTS